MKIKEEEMKTPPHPSTPWFVTCAITVLGAFAGTNVASLWWGAHPILAVDALVLGIMSAVVGVVTGIVACFKRWYA